MVGLVVEDHVEGRVEVADCGDDGAVYDNEAGHRELVRRSGDKA